jgi:DNA-binding NarL/FixJ family response regulator
MIKYKITLVDDEQLFKAGVKLLLELENDIEVVHEASNGQELLDLVEEPNFESDVILLDLSMPVLDGIDTLKILNERDHGFKIIILSSHYNDSIILKLLDEGVSGFLAKNEDPEVVMHTIRKVAENGFYINDSILQLIRNRRLIAKTKETIVGLTARELEIIALICNGFTTKEIAQELYISPRTVEGHRNRILEKTSCKNIACVVIYAIEHNIYEVNITKFR